MTPLTPSDVLSEVQADLERTMLDLETAKEAIRRAQVKLAAMRWGMSPTQQRRTKAEVLAARNTQSGCCNRHADYHACNCLDEAI